MKYEELYKELLNEGFEENEAEIIAREFSN